MHITIALPGLLWQNLSNNNAHIDNLYKAKHANNLNSIIKHAEKYKIFDLAYNDLMYSIGQNVSSHKQSLAKNLAFQLNISTQYNNFLIAQPTHLHIDGMQITCSDSNLLNLDTDMAKEIICYINQHIEKTFKLYYINPNLWLLGFDSNLNIEHNKLYPLLDIIGENIDKYLPSGQNGILYTKVFNELQMLLFNRNNSNNWNNNTNPKIQSLWSANGIWLWDKAINSQIFTKFNHIATNNLDIQMWNTKILPIKHDMLNVDKLFTDKILIILDNLYYPYQYGNEANWVHTLEYLDQTIVYTLQEHLYSQKITQLDIWIPMQNNTLVITIRKYDKYKFWRKNLCLTKLAKDYHAD